MSGREGGGDFSEPLTRYSWIQISLIKSKLIMLHATIAAGPGEIDGQRKAHAWANAG